MKIDKVKLIYFSPTGTTRKILEYIAEGVGVPIERVDLTRPDFAAKKIDTFGKELTIIGVPVYVGRVPVLAIERLHKLSGDGTPAALVVDDSPIGAACVWPWSSLLGYPRARGLPLACACQDFRSPV